MGVLGGWAFSYGRSTPVPDGRVAIHSGLSPRVAIHEVLSLTVLLIIQVPAALSRLQGWYHQRAALVAPVETEGEGHDPVQSGLNWMVPPPLPPHPKSRIPTEPPWEGNTCHARFLSGQREEQLKSLNP